MRTRNLLMGLTGVVLAAAVAIAVLYVNGSRGGECGGAACGGPLVMVIIATEDVPANQRLDPLIENGVFEEIMVPQVVLLHGAITDLDDLRGLMTATHVFANEQMSTALLWNGEHPGPV
jgi:hypothetical protein